MKYLFIVFLLSTHFFANGQSTGQIISRDSVEYYQRQLNMLWKNTFDSLKNSDQYNQILSNLKRFTKKSQNYVGFSVFGDVIHSDYRKFNESIGQNGFTPLNSTMYRIGFGMSNKRNRTIKDFYFGIVGFNNKSKKEGEAIKTSLSNLFQFDFGYDLIRSRVLDIYPFMGLSIRFSNLNYSKSKQTNSSYTNITNIITNNQDVVSSSARIGYQAGLGVDVIVKNRKDESGFTTLFAKIGVNRPIGIDKYKIEGIKYSPGIKQGILVISFGIKFLNKK